jgi:hypothetical protein
MSETWKNILNDVSLPGSACRPGEFRVAAVGLDHNHIYEMCQGLVEAGASVELVLDADPAKGPGIPSKVLFGEGRALTGRSARVARDSVGRVRVDPRRASPGCGSSA